MSHSHEIQCKPDSFPGPTPGLLSAPEPVSLSALPCPPLASGIPAVGEESWRAGRRFRALSPGCVTSRRLRAPTGADAAHHHREAHGNRDEIPPRICCGGGHLEVGGKGQGASSSAGGGQISLTTVEVPQHINRALPSNPASWVCVQRE